MKSKEQIAKDLKGRDFLSITQLSKEELYYILDLAADIKDKFKRGTLQGPQGKNSGYDLC